MTTSTKSSGGTKIVAGIAVFAICSIIQAAMGDSSMFSMTYTSGGGFFEGLLVNITFWPGWIATVALIGGGTIELLDGNTGEAEPKPWELE